MLDLGLPDIDGMSYKTDQENSKIPILVVRKGGRKRKNCRSGRSADDYISKPFNMGELMAE